MAVQDLQCYPGYRRLSTSSSWILYAICASSLRDSYALQDRFSRHYCTYTCTLMFRACHRNCWMYCTVTFTPRGEPAGSGPRAVQEKDIVYYTLGTGYSILPRVVPHTVPSAVGPVRDWKINTVFTSFQPLPFSFSRCALVGCKGLLFQAYRKTIQYSAWNNVRCHKHFS